MKKLPLYATLLASLVLVSCGGSGGGAVIVDQTPPIAVVVNARYQIVLKDLATDSAITDPLAVAITGAAVVKSANGTTLNGTTLTTTSGFVAVDAAFTTAANSFNVKVTDAGSKGWIASGVTITAESGAKGDRVVEIKLLNPNNVAAINAAAAVPVTMAVQSTNVAAGGALTAPVTSTTPAKAVTTAEGTTAQVPVAKATIPTGAVATTSTGAPAAAGALSLTATSFSNANVESLQAFPGGFAAKVSSTNAAVLNGASADAGALTTAAFAEFTVKDSAGNAIKNFSQPITISMDLPKTTVDANGAVVAAGQQFPIWSFDDVAQAWKFETQGLIAEKAPVDPNYFSVSFQTNHLTYWSASVFRQTCDATVTLTNRPTGDTRSLEVVAVGAESGRFYSTETTTGSSVPFTRIPKSGNGQGNGSVTVFDSGVKVGQVLNVNLCAGVSVPLSLAPASTGGTVRFETSEFCSISTSVTRPIPTFVNVTTSAAFLPGYTSTLETAVYSTTLTPIPAGTNVKASALNPNTNRFEEKSITVTSGQTTTVSFPFANTSCRIPTGGASAVF